MRAIKSLRFLKPLSREYSEVFRQITGIKVLLIFLVFITLWLRLVNLGYSDYQGDEIRALWLPASGQGAMSFLYTQSKGPMQYLVTYLIKVVDPTYANQFFARLPYTLAGILAIYFFYQLVRTRFGSKIAIYAAVFMACNGLFVGLMRVVQYQPFVMLFSVLALYCFSLASQRESWKFRGITLGFAFWTIALFSHYDGIFIAPLVAYLLFLWFRRWEDLTATARWRVLIIPSIVCTLLLGAYFVPYVLSVPSGIQDYWIDRITGEQEIGLLPSSIYTFQLYNPILGLYVYAALGVFSLIKIKIALPALAWLALPWAFMELIIHEPGTHIYTYLLPTAILVGIGVTVLEEFVLRINGKSLGIWLNTAWISVMFASLAAISHLIFVDHTPEYPFEQRRIMFWTIGGRNETYHQWNYGFPYYRHWEEIRDFLATQESNGYFASNEKFSITSFYLPYTNDLDRAGYYLYIHNPQSFRVRDLRGKVRYWRERYPPDKIFENQGRVAAEVYFIAPGTLQEIKKAGY